MPTSPFNGYIARPTMLRFCGDPHKVSAYHYQQAKSLECDRDGLFSPGNHETAIGSTRSEAVWLLRESVGDMLRRNARLSGAPFEPMDWRFTPYLGDVKAGRFWPNPSLVGSEVNPL